MPFEMCNQVHTITQIYKNHHLVSMETECLKHDWLLDVLQWLSIKPSSLYSFNIKDLQLGRFRILNALLLLVLLKRYNEPVEVKHLWKGHIQETHSAR